MSDPHALARAQLLTTKIKLLEKREGSVLLVEGEIGSGKTELLRRFVHATLPGTARVVCTAGSPFDRTSVLGVWKGIFRQLLDAVCITGFAEAHQDAVRKLLVQHIPEALPYAPLLNEVLQLNPGFEETKESKDVEGEEKLSDVRKLLLHLLRGLTDIHSKHGSKIVIVIDDAFYLDSESWRLAYGIATEGAIPPASSANFKKGGGGSRDSRPMRRTEWNGRWDDLGCPEEVETGSQNL